MSTQIKLPARRPLRQFTSFAPRLQLNHYNLFGSGYLGDCERLLSRLVKRLK